MALADRLFGRRASPPQVDLAELLPGLTAAVARYAGQPVEPVLVRARFADRCRDAGLTPLLPAEFDTLAVDLDEEAWRRLGVLAGTLDLDGVREALPPLVAQCPLTELTAAAFTVLARETTLLTLELLRQSPLRVEELARRFVAALGATVRGESAEESRKRRERLDYGRLLAEAERAKEAAAERVAQLRKLQDEQEKRRSPRGKW